jgi:hypothetical protein
MSDDKTTEYSKFAATRQENLGKLVNALRSDPVLLSEFGQNPTDIAKRYELSLARDEAQRITDLVIANPAVGEIDPGLLEVVAGGGENGVCNGWKCG